MNKVPFYCPMCGELTEASLLKGTVFADPWDPVLKCLCCQTSWRIELFEIETEEKEKDALDNSEKP